MQISIPIYFGYTQQPMLTLWGRVTHICVGNLTIIGSDNGLSPGQHQAIIWSSTRMLSIWPFGTSFSEILIETHLFFKKNACENVVCDLATTLSRLQYVKGRKDDKPGIPSTVYSNEKTRTCPSNRICLCTWQIWILPIWRTHLFHKIILKLSQECEL